MLTCEEWLYLPSGSLLAVSASELIQRLSYPELEMETFFELKMEAGWYAIWNEGTDKIMYCKKRTAKRDYPEYLLNLLRPTERFQYYLQKSS